MRTVIALIVTLGLTLTAAAKDHSNDYQAGTLSKLTVKDGWIDTTRCSGDVGSVHCTGGIEDAYTDKFILTLADGVQSVIEHVAFRPDTVKGLNLDSGAAVKILYRIQHVKGLVSVDYAIIPDANGKKEGWYTFDGHFKKPTAPAPTAPAPSNVSNLQAMCNSDKLSADLKAQYCK